jgi:hypothetical protein
VAAARIGRPTMHVQFIEWLKMLEHMERPITFRRQG